MSKYSRKINRDKFSNKPTKTLKEIVDNAKDNVGYLMNKEGDKIINEIVERNKDDKFVNNDMEWVNVCIPKEDVINNIKRNAFENGQVYKPISPEEMNKFVKELSKKISPTYCEYPLNKTKEEDKLCENPKTFDDFCKYIMDLHHRKNTDYGNAFHELYKKFGALNYVYPRLYEKLSRVESLLRNKKDAKTSDCALVADEKISDTLLDIATYCIMTVEEMQYD